MNEQLSASTRVSGIVINLNAFGATVRLADGVLATAAAPDVEAHRAHYERGLRTREALAFERRENGRRPTVTLAPQISTEQLDQHIAQYLKSTEGWEPSDGVPAHERHFLRKKRRAALWESKHQR